MVGQIIWLRTVILTSESSKGKTKHEKSKYSDKAAVAKCYEKLNVAKGYVEGKEVEVLRDQG